MDRPSWKVLARRWRRSVNLAGGRGELGTGERPHGDVQYLMERLGPRPKQPDCTAKPARLKS